VLSRCELRHKFPVVTFGNYMSRETVEQADTATRLGYVTRMQAPDALRAKAAAIRSLVHRFRDEESRKLLIKIAEDYERAADLAEKKAQSGNPP
jgi:hypothetical protein